MAKQQSQSSNLQFLKLGGSLITDKTQPQTPRYDVLTRLAGEIAAARDEQPNLKLILGHGSGSFGHVLAKRHDTLHGVYTKQDWRGFGEVWFVASTLNHLVMEALHAAGLPGIALPPSANITATNGQIAAWDLSPLTAALDAGLLPVVYGDVVFDTMRGGTILSTEDLFGHLARRLGSQRLLLAGLEPGVWADYPQCTQLLPAITTRNLDKIVNGIGGSEGDDVTGGMLSKVIEMMALVQEICGLEVMIFSGETPESVQQALLGANPGTRLLQDSHEHH